MQKGQAGTEYSSWEPSIARTLFLGLLPLTLCTRGLQRNQVGPSRLSRGAVLLYPVGKAGVAAMVGASRCKVPITQCDLSSHAV